MGNSVLDIIKQGYFHYTDRWRNNKYGAIADWKYNGTYRFYECYIGENGMLQRCHPDLNSTEDNPIVAVGIVAYWLEHRTGDETVRQMFENYTEKRFEQFKNMLGSNAQTWDWEETDWKKNFYNWTIHQELHWNEMSEPLFDFITDSDAEQVRLVMENYIKYLEKCREAYQAPSTDEDKEKLIDKIYIYFKDEEAAKRFLKQLQALDTDEEKIELVKKYRDAKLCVNPSKNMWQVLHDARLYGKGYTNWNQMLKKE